ncbi:MAG: GTPase Era [Oscillospiraceae bacterium]|jgi:GTP-binding protein Era|nr:GTPase Era [Oscillospiraceae bacterium]
MQVERAGVAAVVGRPNAGKSTLINKLCGERIAIVTPKPQTTRTRLCAVCNRPPVQMVLIDTPGFHAPRTKLGKLMVKTVRESVRDVDAAVLVVEPVPSAGDIERDLIAQCGKAKVPFYLVVNKIDTLPREKLLPVIAAYQNEAEFTAILPLSARTGDGVEELAAMLLEHMPPSPALFPEGMSSDQTDRVLIAETVREKLLLCLDDEVPHGAAVTVEKLGERGDGLVRIEAVITCEKEGHKGIVIGKGGAMLKKIGSLARAELEEMYGGPVFLKLWVRVRGNWRDSDAQLRNLGFR